MLRIKGLVDIVNAFNIALKSINYKLVAKYFCSTICLFKLVLNLACFFQTTDLIRALQELENAASGDAAVHQRIASLPIEVQDVSLLDRITGEGWGPGNLNALLRM